MHTFLVNILNNFTKISIADLDRVKLLNRTDTKFVFTHQQLLDVLPEIKDYYNILYINNSFENNYKTLYYDTPDFIMYLNHHNGKKSRTKIRFRQYLESKLNYFEIKNKSNKGRTIKHRKPINYTQILLTEEEQEVIVATANIKSNKLEPKIWNEFTRLTFAHKTKNERLTIDLNLRFTDYQNPERQFELKNIVIAEVKQEKLNIQSEFIQALKKRHIRMNGFSKYCTAVALLFAKNVKTNNFKEKLLFVNKLMNYA
ncbi:MAG: polyphosphate polymerase domain-containing protein [Vicingaceae bacterium]